MDCAFSFLSRPPSAGGQSPFISSTGDPRVEQTDGDLLMVLETRSSAPASRTSGPNSFRWDWSARLWAPGTDGVEGTSRRVRPSVGQWW